MNERRLAALELFSRGMGDTIDIQTETADRSIEAG